MSPNEEREKLKAEEAASRKAAFADCHGCRGRGRVLMGRFPTMVTCPDCGGHGSPGLQQKAQR